MGWLLLIPAGYFVIGLGVVAWAILGTPRALRPGLHDGFAAGLVVMVCWPMVLWAFWLDGNDRREAGARATARPQALTRSVKRAEDEGADATSKGKQ